MRKVTWRRFDQSAKQLVVGQTTMFVVVNDMVILSISGIYWEYIEILDSPACVYCTLLQAGSSMMVVFWYCIQGDIQVLWHCWLGGRKGIRPVKNWVVGCWHGYLERGADLHMAQLMSLPLTVSCFSKIQIGFTFLVPAHLGSPGQRAVITGLCVCVCYIRWPQN